MTREEAVEVLKERYLTCIGIGLDNHANRVNEAIDMAIEALSAEAPKPTGELITRADAIEAVMAEGRKVYTSEYANAERIIYEADAVEALSMLPSADAVKYESTVTLNSPISISAEAPTIDAKGVLVKGMEMPKNCVVCKFGDAPEFERFCIVQGYKHLGEWDKTLDRPSDCPLVEITPHAQKEISAEAVQGWIPFKTRPLTDEEKQEYPDWTYIFDCPLPDDGEEILLSNGKYVWTDTFINDGECYLDGGDDIDDGMAWMPLPKPYEPKTERRG